MVSRKNIKYKMQQDAKRVPHYGIRKLSIGVASVLIGTTMYIGLAHADTVATSNEPVPIPQATASTTVQSVSNNVVTSSDTVQSDNQNKQNVEPVTSSAVAQSNKLSASNQNQEQQQVQSSPSNTSNNVQNNNLNLSTDFQNHHFIGLRENLAQDNRENVAKNVQGDWSWQGTSLSQSGINSTLIGASHRVTLKLSFDVDGSQLKTGSYINVATLSQTSNNSGLATFAYENVSAPVFINGQNIGSLETIPTTLSKIPNTSSICFSKLQYQLHVTASNLNLTGLQHINFSTVWIGTLDVQSPWSFRGNKSSLITFDLTGDGLDKKYQVLYSWPNYEHKLENNAVYDAHITAGFNLNDSGSDNVGVDLYYPILQDADPLQLQLFRDSDGRQGSFSLNKNFQYAVRIRADKNNEILWDHVATKVCQFWYPVVDNDGNFVMIMEDSGWNDLSFGNPWVDYKCAFVLSQKQFQDNLTVQQLKALNFVGVAGSRQSDGSFLFPEMSI